MRTNFHWMIKENYSRKELESVILDCEDVGYSSVLLPFQVSKNEPISSASFLASKFNKINLMIAIRPYTITPLHFAMFCKTFYDLYGNRLIVNFVAGTNDEEEYLFTKQITSKQNRKIMTKNFIEELLGVLDDHEKPAFAVSGSSKESLETFRLYGDISINLMSDFLNNKKEILDINKRNMVRLSIDLDNVDYEDQCIKQKNNSFIGNEKNLLIEIQNISSNGITDLLISNTYENKNSRSIHDFVKRNKI